MQLASCYVFYVLTVLRVIAGKLERKAVLKAICAGFEETTEPAVCLDDGTHYHLL